jgi:hypothetical protein
MKETTRKGYFEEIANLVTLEVDDDLKAVFRMLDISEDHFLEAEVILTLIKYAKKYPEESIEELVEFALEEWDLV